MYERFYGLTRTPFAVTPDPAMLFMSKVHREALATIIYGVETRKGFIVCTGEVGTGKSTIIRAFFDQALADAVKLIYIFTPQVSPLEMAKYICREMGLDEPDSVFAAVPQLQLKLLETFEAGKTVVLMIDEAQLLPPETLEFLRLLSNFETDTEKLIQIVLVGQPEVDTMLARRDMRQVNQRVALRARLSPLSVEESFEYIDHRVRVSGAADLAQVMSPSAAWLVAEAAGGIPRVINILADNALIAGFGAAQRPLGSQLAGATIRDFLAKSGPAKPVTGQRLGAGFRAAMRLKSALARNEERPDDASVAAGPIAIRAKAPARISPAPIPPARIAPAPVPPAPAAAAAVPPGWPAPEQRQPTSPPPAPEQVYVPAPQPVPVSVEPKQAEQAVAPALLWVEPVFEPAPPQPELGLPVSVEDVVITAPAIAAPQLIEPEPQAAPLPDQGRLLGPPPPDRPTFVLPRPRVAPPRPMPYVTGPRPAPAQPPRALGPPMQWPALSRVRSGLPRIGYRTRDER